ncbi:MAG: FprA family A-type flavoprotein [Candidatus Omnitrophica bacterium]|nr:FprA family A-type flavoprotein [Candidatus Omnitrophota bacterium]
MIIKEIKENIYAIITNDWDRRLFDELIPLPEGTSYNSYFLKDEKNVIIDSSDPRTKDKLFKAIEQLKIEKIDFIISNHSEQDHSGTIPDILEKFKQAKVITSEKGKEFLKSLLLIPEDRIISVKDGEKINIGQKTLQFIYAPFVHWPETILTYEIKNKILFPCDLFGSHLATSKIWATENDFLKGAKRYYAEIMMPFRNQIKKHLEKLKNYQVEIIAPSHGPVYDKPEVIIDAYNQWVSDNVKNCVVILYVSMHGSIKKAVDYFVKALIEKDIEVKPFNLTETDIGELAISLVDSATVIIGTPTVIGGPHPYVLSATYLFKILKPKTKFVSIIGSFLWGTNMLKYFEEILKGENLEIIEPVIFKGFPTKEIFEKLETLAEKIYQKHKELNLI